MIKANRFSSRWTWIAGILISVVCLFLVLRSVDWTKVFQTIFSVEPRLLLIPFILNICIVLLKPWRWRFMFPRKVRPKYWACFNILIISNLNNLILPARGGDIIRCLLIKRENKAITASFALGTLGLEKILDTLILLIVVLFSFYFIVPPFWLKQLTLISISVLGLIVATLFIIFRKMEKFNSLLLAVFRKVRLVSLGERIGTLLENFANGFKAIKAPDRIAKIVVISLAVWIAEAAMTWGFALSLDIPLSFYSAIIVLAVVGLAQSIPAAPGFIGTYEFFMVSVLKMFDISSSKALAMTLFGHAWVISTILIAGFFSTVVTGVSLAQLGEKTARKDI